MKLYGLQLLNCCILNDYHKSFNLMDIAVPFQFGEFHDTFKYTSHHFPPVQTHMLSSSTVLCGVEAQIEILLFASSLWLWLCEVLPAAAIPASLNFLFHFS